MTDRRTSDSGRLIRLGFQDLERARRLCASPRLEPLLAGDESDGDVLVDLGLSADPDLALLLLVRILEAADEPAWRRLVAALQADPDLRRRLVEVVGMSEALGDFLARHHSQWEVLADAEALTVAPSSRQMRHDLLVAVGAEPASPEPVASGAEEAVLDRLRVAYRRLLLGIAARDLSGLATMDTVAQWLSDLADCVLEAALAVARAEVGDAADECRFAVIGMGKCGARELNYVSDVDVIFVAEAADGADESRGPVRGHVARDRADAGVHRDDAGGHDLGGRREPAARGQAGRPGAHHRVARRLLRALGQDVGVPGPAQGPAGRRRPRAGARVRRLRQPVRVERGRPPHLRRGRAGDAPPRRAARARAAGRTRAEARARAGSGMSSSPSSCCSSCTAAAT